MNKIWLVQVVCTDDCTYSYRSTVSVCTDEIEAIMAEERAQIDYIGYKIEINEVETNKYLG